MMNSPSLLLILIFCVYFKTISSIRCYGGTDQQCIFMPDVKDCGPNKCQCAKYRFPCTSNDQACTEQERVNQVKKWAYTVVSDATCEQLRLLPGVFEDLTCCSTNGCNRPKNGRCSLFQSNRRAIQRLTDLLDF